MPIVPCTLRGTRAAPLVLHLADKNRVRWTAAGLRSNITLVDSLLNSHAQGQQAILADSITLIQSNRRPLAGTHVILWDGFNSYIELKRKFPELETVDSVRIVIVGRIKDLEASFPTNPIPLFASASATHAAHFEPQFGIELPYSARLRLQWRTRFRALKNALVDHQRHRQLSGERRIVFCGQVRPSAELVRLLMRSSPDEDLATRFAALSNMPLDSLLQDGRIGALFETIRRRTSHTPADIAAAYALLSILHRVCVLSLLAQRKVPMFISEFGRDRHIDPYDASTYRQHLYLDFGSTRGPDMRYPRTVDLDATGKETLSLRLIHEDESLMDFVANTSAQLFLELGAEHSEHVASVASSSYPRNHLSPLVHSRL